MKILLRTLVYAGLVCAGTACKPASSGSSAEKGYEAHVHSHEGHDHSHAGHDHDHDHGHGHSQAAAVSVDGNTIAFSRALQQKVPFGIETVHYETFGPVIKTVAYVPTRRWRLELLCPL